MAYVTLDAMIKRADFAQQTEGQKLELFNTITIRDLEKHGPVVKMLRKPDFQRETNQWKPEQISTFVSSFANMELIPSLILWKSESLVFVIDGGHRLSALRAWIENDYGDGTISHGFFEGNLSNPQIKIAETTRKKVENAVGRFADIKNWGEAEETSPEFKIYSQIFTRTIPVQWIQGSQEVAEVSFFKINSQGTPLDKTEALLLQHRNKSFAVAARSIVRSGSGHKYWSKFEQEQQSTIENISGEIYALLFEPDVERPIKTLDLPLGGTSSPIDALKMLLDIFTIIDGKVHVLRHVKSLDDDKDGTETIEVLKRTRRVVQRLTGNGKSSLGLHPAVYFYDHKGRHSRFMFLGVLKCFANASKNDRDFYRRFTNVRSQLESSLVKKKAEISFALSNISSRTRIAKISDLISGMVKSLNAGETITNKKLIELLNLEGNLTVISSLDDNSSVRVSNETKSAVYLKESLASAVKCKICKGYLEVNRGVSYDHVLRRRDGGDNRIDNIQLTHPFCNSGVKS